MERMESIELVMRGTTVYNQNNQNKNTILKTELQSTSGRHLRYLHIFEVIY